MPTTQRATQQTRIRKKKTRLLVFNSDSCAQTCVASYSDEITFPVLVTTKEPNYDKDDVEKIGCNRQPLVAKQIKYLSFYC